MSTLTTHTTASRDSHSIGLCKFNTTSKAIEVSDGTDWLVYDYDSAILPATSNSSSVAFDGLDDYVDVSGVASSLNSASAFTVSLWYNTSSSNVGLISGGTSSTNGFWLARYSSSTLYFNVRNGGATFLTASVTNANNTWHHVAAICDGSSSKVYLNGSLITTGTLPSLSSTGANGTAVGYITPLGANYLLGNIDEVAIWDSALSVSDVASLRDTSGSNPVPANISSLSPIGWWRMGDGDDVGDGSGNPDGTVVGSNPQVYNMATDSSGNRITGSDGTLTNGPTFSTTVP